jgi:hypothetical protein
MVTAEYSDDFENYFQATFLTLHLVVLFSLSVRSILPGAHLLILFLKTLFYLRLYINFDVIDVNYVLVIAMVRHVSRPADIFEIRQPFKVAAASIAFRLGQSIMQLRNITTFDFCHSSILKQLEYIMLIDLRLAKKTETLCSGRATFAQLHYIT